MSEQDKELTVDTVMGRLKDIEQSMSVIINAINHKSVAVAPIKEPSVESDSIEQKIDGLTQSTVLGLLELEPKVEDKEIFAMKLNQAKLGMAYKRDREIMKRVSNGQMIRVVNLISSDATERKKYIEASMPEYNLLPQTKDVSKEETSKGPE